MPGSFWLSQGPKLAFPVEYRRSTKEPATANSHTSSAAIPTNSAELKGPRKLSRIRPEIFDFESDLGLKLGHTTIPNDSGPISGCFAGGPELPNCEMAQPSWGSKARLGYEEVSVDRNAATRTHTLKQRRQVRKAGREPKENGQKAR